QGRNQAEYLQRSGANLQTVRAQCHQTGFAKRMPGVGRRIIQHVRKISEDEFNALLDKVNIPRPSDHSDMLPVLRDGVFTYISELLRQFGKGEWALRPRTFCILRILGCPEAMESFVNLKRTDAFLPYNDRNLPDAIKGADIRAKFLQLQRLVLSSQHLKELEEERSAHFNFRAAADDNFSSIRQLGQGGFGIVDEVYGPFTLKYFARKRIHRGISALQDQRALGSFEKELTVLKAASHRHLVKLVSSYSDPTYVGLIMRPVADQDLKKYLLQNPGTDVDSSAQRQCLRTFFGCLTKALEYLHQHRIIHKDIKPQNVLVKKEEVYLTDFGTSKTLGEMSKSLSTGRNDKVTPRYCAPEVADQEPRGRRTDIWSMGCVFLEMATVLLGHSLDDMEAYYASHGTESRYFYKNREATKGWIEQLRSGTRSHDIEVLEWITAMLQESQTDRPTAPQMVAKISDAESDQKFFCFSCLHENCNYNECSDPQAKTSNSDLVTGALLQSYLRRDSIHDTDTEDDTVTSKVLEENGVVSVATEVEHLEDTTNFEELVDEVDVAQSPNQLGASLNDPRTPVNVTSKTPEATEQQTKGTDITRTNAQTGGA
ncbi:kinase-like protein, partial [Lentithecium fluviatile CBS 122367]